MKKGIKILLVIIGIAIVLGLIFFAVNYNRIHNSEELKSAENDNMRANQIEQSGKKEKRWW